MSTEGIQPQKPGTVSLADEEAVKEILVSSALIREHHTRWQLSKRADVSPAPG